MDEKTFEILNFLKQGKSYQQIQSLLHVSPSKIAKVKRDYFDSDCIQIDDSSSNFGSGSFDNTTSARSTSINSLSVYGSDVDGSQNFTENSDDDVVEYDVENMDFYSAKTEEESHTSRNQQFKTTNNSDYAFLHNQLTSSQRAEVIMRKIELDHELNLKKLESEKEKMLFQKQKLEFEREKAFNMQKHKENKFIIKFKKLLQKINDGEWSYDDIIDFCESVILLTDEIEKHCIQYNYDTGKLMILLQLYELQEETEKMLNQLNDDIEYYSLRFKYSIHKMKEKSKNLLFDDTV